MKLGIGAIILIALGWIAWPFYAAYDLATAIQGGDHIALERRVAWDEVRRGLRDDLNAVLLQALRKDDGASSPLTTGLVAMLGPTFINNAVDSYVTPQAIAGLIQNGAAPIPSMAQIKSGAAHPETMKPVPDKQQNPLSWKQVRYAFFSGGPMTFRIDIDADNAPTGQRPVTLLFKWSGDWKLARMFLPLDALQNRQADTNASMSRLETQEETQSRRDVEAKARRDMEVKADLAALRSRLARLWTVPAGAKTAEELIVRVRFQLKPDRTLVGPPVVLTSATSALSKVSRDSAVRAIITGQPFDMLRPEHYAAWKDIEVTFDPREKL
jgi:hypothetical protein